VNGIKLSAGLATGRSARGVAVAAIAGWRSTALIGAVDASSPRDAGKTVGAGGNDGSESVRVTRRGGIFGRAVGAAFFADDTVSITRGVEAAFATAGATVFFTASGGAAPFARLGDDGVIGSFDGADCSS